MKPLGKSILQPAALAVMLLLAASAYLWAYRQLMFYKTQIEARHQELRELEEMADRHAGQRAAYTWFQNLDTGMRRVEDLVQQKLPGAEADLVQRGQTQVDDRWRSRRYDLRIDRVSSEKLGAFLLACENAVPRIRVNELQVSALQSGESMVSAQLSISEMVASE